MTDKTKTIVVHVDGKAIHQATVSEEAKIGTKWLQMVVPGAATINRKRVRIQTIR